MTWCPDKGAVNNEALEPDFVDNLITLLEQKRYIAVARSLENRAMPDSLVTDRGKAEAQGRRGERVEFPWQPADG